MFYEADLLNTGTRMCYSSNEQFIIESTESTVQILILPCYLLRGFYRTGCAWNCCPAGRYSYTDKTRGCPQQGPTRLLIKTKGAATF